MRQRTSAALTIVALVGAMAFCPARCLAAAAGNVPRAGCHGDGAGAPAGAPAGVSCCPSLLAIEGAAPATVPAPALHTAPLPAAALVAPRVVALPAPRPLGRVGPQRLYLRTHALLI